MKNTNILVIGKFKTKPVFQYLVKVWFLIKKIYIQKWFFYEWIHIFISFISHSKKKKSFTKNISLPWSLKTEKNLFFMLKNSENQYYKESQQNQLHHYRTHYSNIKIPISRLLLKGLLTVWVFLYILKNGLILANLYFFFLFTFYFFKKSWLNFIFEGGLPKCVYWCNER